MFGREPIRLGSTSHLRCADTYSPTGFDCHKSSREAALNRRYVSLKLLGNSSDATQPTRLTDSPALREVLGTHVKQRFGCRATYAFDYSHYREVNSGEKERSSAVIINSRTRGRLTRWRSRRRCLRCMALFGDNYAKSPRTFHQGVEGLFERLCGAHTSCPAIGSV